MADETLDLGYEELVTGVAGGVPHYSDNWFEWFTESGGSSLQERVGQTFTRTGHVPTPPQLEEARALLVRLEDDDQPEEAPAPPRRTAKAKAEDD